jgi:hypothetical protein
MAATDWSRLSLLFDKELKRRKLEAAGTNTKFRAAKQAKAEAKSTEKVCLPIMLDSGEEIFLKGGQHSLLRHEANLLGDLEKEVTGSDEARFFNFPLWTGTTRDGHFLMAFKAVGKPLTGLSPCSTSRTRGWWKRPSSFWSVSGGTVSHRVMSSRMHSCTHTRKGRRPAFHIAE